MIDYMERYHDLQIAIFHALFRIFIGLFLQASISSLAPGSNLQVGQATQRLLLAHSLAVGRAGVPLVDGAVEVSIIGYSA